MYGMKRQSHGANKMKGSTKKGYKYHGLNAGPSSGGTSQNAGGMKKPAKPPKKHGGMG